MPHPQYFDPFLSESPFGADERGRPRSLPPLVGEGDLVAGQWIARGTHTGELFGVPATGTAIEYQALDVYRLRNGKIVEQWAGDDVMSLLQQIGVISPPAQS